MKQPHWTQADACRLHRMLLDHPDTVERLYPDTELAERSRGERAAAREAMDAPLPPTRAARHPSQETKDANPTRPRVTRRRPRRRTVAQPEPTGVLRRVALPRTSRSRLNLS